MGNRYLSIWRAVRVYLEYTGFREDGVAEEMNLPGFGSALPGLSPFLSPSSRSHLDNSILHLPNFHYSHKPFSHGFLPSSQPPPFFHLPIIGLHNP